MHAIFLATLFGLPRLPLAMCVAGLVVLVIGIWAAKDDFAQARGLDKIVALANVCFAIPLAVFGTLHLFGPEFVKDLVPSYMPSRMFWVYFVGSALIAAALSIATKIAVRWSALLVGLTMFSFVAMIYIPGAIQDPHNRIIWTIVFRESSFGGGAWVLAGSASNGWSVRGKSVLITVGRIFIALAAIVFGVEHFLHPLGLPGVPLERLMPTWVPGRVLIDYATGAALIVTGACILLNRMVRPAATAMGSWLMLLIIVIYVPVMITLLGDANIPTKVEGINYFADTLLFASEFLAVARATRG